MKVSRSPFVLISRPVKKLCLYLDAEGPRFDQLVQKVALLIGGSYLRTLKEVVVEGYYVLDHSLEGCLVLLLPLTEFFNLSLLSLGLFLYGRHSGLNLLMVISQVNIQGIELGLQSYDFGSLVFKVNDLRF
jgi:hypothetical protein